MIKVCKTCNKEFETNNKHRNECYECRSIKVHGTIKPEVKKSFNKKELILGKIKTKKSWLKSIFKD